MMYRILAYILMTQAQTGVLKNYELNFVDLINRGGGF